MRIVSEQAKSRRAAAPRRRFQTVSGAPLLK
jgi:hypothetical protein